MIRPSAPARLHWLCFDVAWCCSSWLKGAAESTVGKLDHRISMLTGLNAKHPHGEYLQVVNYGIGGHYEPHFDHATVSWLCKLVWWFSWLKLCWLQRLIPTPTPTLSSHHQVPCTSWKLETALQLLWYMWVLLYHHVTPCGQDSRQIPFPVVSKALIRNTKGGQFFGGMFLIKETWFGILTQTTKVFKLGFSRYDNIKLLIFESKDLLSV